MEDFKEIINDKSRELRHWFGTWNNPSHKLEMLFD